MLSEMTIYQGLINNPVLLLLCSFVLYKIVFLRQRRELFLVMFPVLLWIQSFWWFCNCLGQVEFHLNYYNQTYLMIGDITNGLYALAHWIFAAQYHRTSVLLPEMFKQSLLKVQMGLFEQQSAEASVTDRIMNRLSKESVIRSNQNPKENNMILSTLDIDSLQFYIEMIDEQKKRIKKKQRTLHIFNFIVVSIFVTACLCDIFQIFGERQNFYSQLLYITPLYLTCIVFIVALCKIQSSIRAITIAHLH